MNFWETLPKPFFAMAPMADVTDAAFRRLFATYGKPDVMWTEFVSADGLYYTREKAKMKDTENPLMRDLLYTEAERPIVAQFFSARPEMMEYAARLAQELGFDGVDINMGCPDRTIEKQGAGAALMKNQTLAREIIAAAKIGAKTDTHDGIPVSVKTRIGYNKDETDSWLPVLLESGIAALTVHARTRKEMSLVPARWEHVAHAVLLRNTYAPTTLILGNGDVGTLAEGSVRAAETGCDGIMVGRGIFGNPWRFSKEISADAISIEDKLRVLAEHARLFEELLPHKSFAIMKKHFKAYVAGWEGAKELRAQLMEAQNALHVRDILREYVQKQKDIV